MMNVAVSKTGGLTLIELVVVIALVAILLTLAVPSFQSYSASQQVRSASDALIGAFNRARSEAVTRNREVTITPGGGDWHDGWEIIVDGEVISAHDALSGVDVAARDSDDDPVASMIYNRDGRVTAGVVRFDINTAAGGGARERCVRVGLSGTTSVNEGTCP